MTIQQIDAWSYQCPECSYESEIVDSIEAKEGSIRQRGFICCNACGTKIDLPRNRKATESEKEAA